MKKLYLSFIAFFFCSALYAQTIKIENGVTCSSMRTNTIDILNRNILDYSLFVGCDYLDHEHYYLSSEIGYTTKGGKETAEIFIDGPIDIQDTWQYLHLNTTFRYKYNVNVSHLFVGIGPKVDVLIGSTEFPDVIYKDYFEMNRFSFGCIAEMGVAQDVGKLRFGVNYSYFINFGSVGQSQYCKVYNNTHLLRLSIGYTL